MFTMPSNGKVTMKVYDVLGRLITNVELGEYERGYHEYKFRADGISSGIYFYQLELKGASGSAKTSYGKMVLIK
jgi:hypothetical protein